MWRSPHDGIKPGSFYIHTHGINVSRECGRAEMAAKSTRMRSEGCEMKLLARRTNIDEGGSLKTTRVMMMILFQPV